MTKHFNTARWKRVVAMAFAAALLTGIATRTVSQDSRRPEAFAERFVAAVNSRNPDREKGILHPQTQACMNSETQPYFAWIFSNYERGVTSAPRNVVATPVPAAPAALPTDGHSEYPIRPTHQLQIDFGTATKGSTIVLFVIHDGKDWREVLPCPRGDVRAQAKAKQIAQEQNARKVDALVRGMSAGLRSEIMDLLQSGRTVEAMTRYAAVTGEELSIARSVIESLQSR